MENLKKLQTLAVLLGKDSLILTGSTALAYHGLLRFDEAKDLDLLINEPDGHALDTLTKLQVAAPTPKFKEGGPVNYSFFFEGVKVDVWVVKRIVKRNHLTTELGVKVASVADIVQAKINIGRPKDWTQLMQLSQVIFDPYLFQNSLTKINSSPERY